MVSRISNLRRGDNEPVHVWGADFEECAVAVELAGTTVLRLDSGGFVAENTPEVQEALGSGKYRVAHDDLSWVVVQWRELGRSLFKDVVVEQEEETASASPDWGTEEMEPSYDTEMRTISSECARRMMKASEDDVLVMCTWRVFDRQRAVLSARYGLGSPERPGPMESVLDEMGVKGEARTRLRQLWIASQAWW